MHGVVPIEPAERARAILVVDTFILALDPVVILDPIFGHGPNSLRSIDRRISLCVASAVTLRELASWKLHRSRFRLGRSLIARNLTHRCEHAGPDCWWTSNSGVLAVSKTSSLVPLIAV